MGRCSSSLHHFFCKQACIERRNNLTDNRFKVCTLTDEYVNERHRCLVQLSLRFKLFHPTKNRWFLRNIVTQSGSFTWLLLLAHLYTQICGQPLVRPTLSGGEDNWPFDLSNWATSRLLTTWRRHQIRKLYSTGVTLGVKTTFANKF